MNLLTSPPRCEALHLGRTFRGINLSMSTPCQHMEVPMDCASLESLQSILSTLEWALFCVQLLFDRQQGIYPVAVQSVPVSLALQADWHFMFLPLQPGNRSLKSNSTSFSFGSTKRASFLDCDHLSTAISRLTCTIQGPLDTMRRSRFIVSRAFWIVSVIFIVGIAPVNVVFHLIRGVSHENPWVI